jgi:hypothetical protein
VKIILICSKGCRHQLTWTTDRSASSYGLGVLLDSKGSVFDGASLRAGPLARIETDNPEQVCGALGIEYPDRQVVQK